MLLIRGHGQRKRFCRGPLRWPLQQAKGKPIGACSRLHTVTKESLGLCEAANEFGQRSSAAASLGSTSSSTRPPAQAAHCRAGLTVKVQSLSATQACSRPATPGQDLYPAAGPAAFESPCPEVATRPIASFDNRLPALGGAGAMTKGGPGGQLVRAACPDRQSFRRSYCQVDG